MMECYYDIQRADEFDTLFADTWIQHSPTPEKSSYLVLRFDFSLVHGTGEALKKSFADHIRLVLMGFCTYYAPLIGSGMIDKLLQETQPHKQLERLLGEIRPLRLPLYLFIDEYDNFANTLLASVGQSAYQELTHGRGFFRDFFAELKGAAGATGSALARLFITGVSPITLDDVTSGFNIGLNISLDPDINGILGFNEAELEQLFAAFGQSYADHRDVMRAWYNHYQFSRYATESITNSDMALYYLQALNRIKQPPDELIDQNVRIDYGKLRHLIQLDRRLNGSFKRLQEIIQQGRITSQIRTSFPAERLQESENFVSLLYFFGLLTFSGEMERDIPVLTVPNQTIWQLMYSYLREALYDVGLFRPDIYTIGERLSALAWEGEWRPFFSLLAEKINEQAGVRDYLQGEKMIQGFLMAWLNLTPWFNSISEQELGGGFVDLYLYPFYARHPHLSHAYLIELKYLKRGEDSPAARQQKMAEAKRQLQQYQSDQRILSHLGHAKLHSIILLYCGWELVEMDEL
jgi:hypothetical protein